MKNRHPLRIQLTIQGGGAKFITMLPAAQAFCDKRTAGDIYITRVSGASAGSIVAALIATNANFERVFEFLDNNGDRYVGKMRGISRFMPFSFMRKGWWILKVVSGYSVVSPRLLRRFLIEMFSYSCPDLRHINGDVSKVTIADIEKRFNCKLRIGLSSLTTLEGSEAEPKTPFISALVDSCSIPLFFRNIRNIGEGRFVDGGLCENLPTSSLFEDIAQYGDLFAITTSEPQDSNFSTVFEFMMAVFSASVNHNVKRSIKMVGDYLNVAIESKVTTFDFSGAMAFCRDTQSKDLIYAKALNRLASYAKIKTITDQPNGSFNSGRYDPQSIMDGIFQFHSVVSNGATKNLISTTMALFCNSLNWAEQNENDSDISFQQSVFRVGQKPVFSISINFPRDQRSQYLHPMKWQVYDKDTKKIIPSRIIPMKQRNENGVESISCCIFFEKPLSSGKEKHRDYVLEHYIEYIGGIPGLKAAPYAEFLAMSNLTDEVIEEVNLIMLIPKTYRRGLKVNADSSCSELSFGILKQSEIVRISAVLDDYRHDAIGGRFRNLKPGQRARANFVV
ncbi:MULTISPECIES: patatin-like phospholipase family protein [Agrobacterium]|nr:MULTISPECIES: patatin-like phospholipase family protein [Agrobacterium]CUX67067.1 hypothetical protein AGR6A_Lc80029 [Agrobacterium sp. NCPPB 925]